MEKVRIKGGQRFRIAHGVGENDLGVLSSETVGFHPSGTKDFKAKVVVKVGDDVAAGDLLFFNKKNENHRYLSSCSGRVKAIEYGPRRVLEAVVIERSGEAKTSFGSFSPEQVQSLGAEATIAHLVKTGLWSRFLSHPFKRIVPVPGEPAPKDIHGHDLPVPSLIRFHVSFVESEPHLVPTGATLEGNIENALLGLEVLKRTGFDVVAGVSSNTDSKLKSVSGVAYKEVDETLFPAGSAEVQSYFTQPLGAGECVACVDLETLIDIGHVVRTGELRDERTYAVAGEGASKRGHARGPVGLPVATLQSASGVPSGEATSSTDTRLVAGGLLRGKKIDAKHYMGLTETTLNILPEDRERTPFVFFRPGGNRLTTFKLWTSALMKGKEQVATTSNNGEHRGCVQCGQCIKVCPVELMPNLVFKAALAKDIEKMEQLGIRDCTDCGLCTFVCPSKIELGEIVESGKELIVKEG